MDDNEDLFKKILDEPAFQAAVMDHYARRVFEGARGKMPCWRVQRESCPSSACSNPPQAEQFKAAVAQTVGGQHMHITPPRRAPGRHPRLSRRRCRRPGLLYTRRASSLAPIKSDPRVLAR